MFEILLLDKAPLDPMIKVSHVVFINVMMIEQRFPNYGDTSLVFLADLINNILDSGNFATALVLAILLLLPKGIAGRFYPGCQSEFI